MQPHKIAEYVWDLPIGYVEGMRAPARVFASDALFEKALADRAVDQIANVATLPGVVGHVLAMPDIHWGYGFPIGGVAATDVDGGGVISPGGVGFDIGCGVRLVRSGLDFGSEVKPMLGQLVEALGKAVPRGVGGKGRLALDRSSVDDALREGVGFALAHGAGWEEDAELSEDGGRLPDPRPTEVSERAKERGAPQLGSLGAGNHFLEIQVVDDIRDEEAARVMGLEKDRVCVMIHSGSRGLGHQTCTDHLRTIDRLMPELGIQVPDRQLACVPMDHPKAHSYMGAMDAAGNFARANRQVLTAIARETFERVLHRSAEEMSMHLVYDIAHNLAKIESHEIEGRMRTLCVHRKGATRAFGPGHPDVPARYRAIGQPVIIPGSMGSPSFVLVGSERSAERSFSSTCHGAGRTMSRTQAKKMMSGEALRKEMREAGIHIAKSHWKLLSEEAPYAYKDAEEVVGVCEGVGLSSVVARLRPVGVVKG